MLKQGRGRVVNIGAISAHLTVPFYGPIAASKSALASLNDAMRLEFAQYGIQVILVEPGAMKTEIFSRSRAARDASSACGARAGTPLPTGARRNGSRVREGGGGRSGGCRRSCDRASSEIAPIQGLSLAGEQAR